MTATICPASGCHTTTQGGHCPEHRTADNRRRHAKQQAHGRNTAAWRRLRAARIALDDHRCTRCHTTRDLTVHLRPTLNGQHDLATIHDVTTLCRHCHGTTDAPRSNGGHP